jgi:hypothetical protein
MHQPFFRPLPDDDIMDLEPEVSSEGEVMVQAPLPSQEPEIVLVKPGRASMRFTSPWNDETRAIVTEYWGKISAARIAEMIPGVSGRNSVISLAHRMGLPKPGKERVSAKLATSREMLPAGHGWTEAEVEQVRVLRAEGKSYGEIIEATGRTYNSIKHVCSRYAIPRPVRQDKADKPKAEPKPAAIPIRTPPQRVEPSTFKPTASDPSNVVTIDELEHGMCRWPIDTDDGVCYCGRGPIANQPSGALSPYCAKHVAIAYVPTRRQQSERTQVYLSKIA